MWHLAPDLAVEVTSPSNSWSAIQDKVGDFLAAGARLVWVIDPPTRTATVYRPDAAAGRLAGEDEIIEGDVLPQLRIPLPALFPAARPAEPRTARQASR